MRRDIVERDRRAEAVWVLTAVLAVANAVLTILAWGHLVASDAYPSIASSVAGPLYATLGMIIIRRARNRIGWILLAESVAIAATTSLSAYAVVGIAVHPGALPAASMVGAISEWLFFPVVLGLALVLLLFPTATLPSVRWRPILEGLLAFWALALVGFILAPRRVGLPAPEGLSVTYPNPLGIRGLGAVSGLLTTVLPGLESALLLIAATAGLVVRYRSGLPDLRQQIKWVALAGALGVVCQAVAVAGQAFGGAQQTTVTTGAYSVEAAVALVGVPVAITLAILRYGLYQIDVILNRAVAYGLLAAVATGLYLLVVVAFGSLIGYGFGSPLLTTLAAVGIALLFQPLRRRAQRVANRLVYGERASPYQVLADFAEQMAGTLGLDEILDRMVTVLAAGTGATHVDVWIRVGSELRPAATWPAGSAVPERRLLPADDLPELDGVTRAVAVRQGDELLGALAIQKSRNEPLTAAEDNLLQHLASQAGLVLRNVRLTTELRSTIDQLRGSRRRLVEAQNAERRRIERNLHDGAQQQLVALRVQLGLMERVADQPDKVTALAGRLQTALQEALEDLRNLARGIYPPLLADQGLPAALEAQARRSAVPTTVESDGIGRYPEDVESAVYFCALEALQNVAKYASATSAVLRLRQSPGQLTVEIVDDGQGFDPSRTTYGTGLQGMADRLDAIGGTLEVTSEPGRGTTVRGRVPVA